MECAQAGVLVAARFSAGALQVDVTHNGGGRVELAMKLSDFFYRGMPSAATFANEIDSCTWVELPKSGPVAWAVTGMQRPPLDVADAANPKEMLLQYVARLRAAAADMQGVLNGDEELAVIADCLETLLCSYRPFPTNGTAAFGNMRAQYHACLAMAFTDRTQLPVLVAMRSNAKPATGEAATAESVSLNFPTAIYKHDWAFWDGESKSKMRDSPVTDFSARFMLNDCPAYTDYVCPSSSAICPSRFGRSRASQGRPPPQTTVNKITYITDGRCSSACSQHITRPVLEGIASAVSYGVRIGAADDDSRFPLDISSFGAGAVNTRFDSLYSEFARVAMHLKAHQPDYAPPPRHATLMPLPMATTAIAFASHAEYPTILGDDALPREFYKVPAQTHLSWNPFQLDALNHGEPTVVWKGTLNGVLVEAKGMGELHLQANAAFLYLETAKLPFKTMAAVGQARHMASAKGEVKCPAEVPFGKVGASCTTDANCDVVSICECSNLVDTVKNRELLFSSLVPSTPPGPQPTPEPTPECVCLPYH